MREEIVNRVRQINSEIAALQAMQAASASASIATPAIDARVEALRLVLIEAAAEYEQAS
jgi:hypothetical protein